MTKKELLIRVNARKSEIDDQSDKLAEFRAAVNAFVKGIKSMSAVHALVKNLTVWKKLTELIQDGEQHGD